MPSKMSEKGFDQVWDYLFFAVPTWFDMWNINKYDTHWLMGTVVSFWFLST